jgi:Flp pilus assembly protein TadD
MLRTPFLSIGLSVIVTTALAATDLETCRDNQAEAAERLAACKAVTADDNVTGKPKAFANWYIGDSLLKKRDYDGALVVLNKALELDPDNATVLNTRGLAYSNKGEEERALAD